MPKRLLPAVCVILGLCVADGVAGQLRPDEKFAIEAKPAIVLVVVQLQTQWKPQPPALARKFFGRAEVSITIPHLLFRIGF